MFASIGVSIDVGSDVGFDQWVLQSMCASINGSFDSCQQAFDRFVFR
jgi:hypothetical protein